MSPPRKEEQLRKAQIKKKLREKEPLGRPKEKSPFQSTCEQRNLRGSSFGPSQAQASFARLGDSGSASYPVA